MVKTDASGNVSWTKNFGTNDQEEGQSIQVTADGGYIVSAYTYNGYAYLLKTDAGGNAVWTKTFKGAIKSGFSDAKQTLDGGYIAAGFDTAADYSHDVYLVKVDANGNTTWTKTFVATGYQQARSVQQTSDGGYFVGAWSAANSGDVYLIKTDNDGNLE